MWVLISIRFRCREGQYKYMTAPLKSDDTFIYYISFLLLNYCTLNTLNPPFSYNNKNGQTNYSKGRRPMVLTQYIVI